MLYNTINNKMGDSFMESYKIGFIGGGNMANAIINGIILKGLFKNDDIYVSDINSERLCYFGSLNINTTDNNVELIEMCDIIVLSVKPNVAESVLDEIHKFITSNKIVISI